MDVWGTINVGKCWTEEDGTRHEEPEYSTHWQVTTTNSMTGGQQNLLTAVTPEVQRQVTGQLQIILDDVLHVRAMHAGVAPEVYRHVADQLDAILGKLTEDHG